MDQHDDRHEEEQKQKVEIAQVIETFERNRDWRLFWIAMEALAFVDAIGGAEYEIKTKELLEKGVLTTEHDRLVFSHNFTGELRRIFDSLEED